MERREPRVRSLALPSLFTLGVVALGVAMVLGWILWVAALAILVPVVALVYRRPQRGVLIFVVVLTFDGAIKGLGPASVGVWKQVFVVALLVLTFVCPAEARAPRGRRMPGWVPAFAALLVFGLISALFVEPTRALVGLRISYFSILLALVVWRCPLNHRERDNLVTVFMAMAIITSIIGMWQQVVGHEYLANLGYRYDEEIRFTVGLTLRSFSTFDLPFSFGFYLMLAILIGVPMALAEPKRLRSKVFLLSLPLIGVAMLYTFVRGAMLGLAVGLLYLAFHRYKILVWGIPLALCAALFIPAGATLTSAVFGSSSFRDLTTSWEYRVDLIAEHPFGGGIGTTGAAADKTATLLSDDEKLTFQPDNSYLKVAFELGVIGLWLLVLMLVSMFLSTRKAERRVEGTDRDFVAGVSAQFLALMSASLVATYLELVPMDQLFFLMIGIVATLAPDFEPAPAVHSASVEIPPPDATTV